MRSEGRSKHKTLPEPQILPVSSPSPGVPNLLTFNPLDQSCLTWTLYKWNHTTCTHFCHSILCLWDYEYYVSEVSKISRKSILLQCSFSLSILTDTSVQFSSVTQSCPTLCDPMNRSTPGLPVHHQLPEFTQTYIHTDAIQPSHPLSSPSPPAPNPSQHQTLFQWVNSLHEMAKVLEFQLQHQSLQRNPRADFF